MTSHFLSSTSSETIDQRRSCCQCLLHARAIRDRQTSPTMQWGCNGHWRSTQCLCRLEVPKGAHYNACTCETQDAILVLAYHVSVISIEAACFKNYTHYIEDNTTFLKQDTMRSWSWRSSVHSVERVALACLPQPPSLERKYGIGFVGTQDQSVVLSQTVNMEAPLLSRLSYHLNNALQLLGRQKPRSTGEIFGLSDIFCSDHSSPMMVLLSMLIEATAAPCLYISQALVIASRY